ETLPRIASDKPDDRASECVEHILSSTERLDQLVRDVLDYSRISRGEIKVEPIDLDHLVHDIVREQPVLEPANADIRIESPLLRVQGHKASSSQAIANLLTNAVKFVPHGKFTKVR